MLNQQQGDWLLHTCCLVLTQVPVTLGQGKSTNLTASVQSVLVLKDAGANVPTAIILTPYGRFAVFANGTVEAQLSDSGLQHLAMCWQAEDYIDSLSAPSAGTATPALKSPATASNTSDVNGTTYSTASSAGAPFNIMAPKSFLDHLFVVADPSFAAM
jgi:hypothetical protein